MFLSLPRVRNASVSLRRSVPSIAAWLGLVLGAALLLVAIQGLVRSSDPQVKLTVTDPAAALLLSGFHAIERDQGRAFRWSDGTARIQLPLPGNASAMLMTIQLGPGAPLPSSQATLSFGSTPFASFTVTDQARNYRLLVPQSALQGWELDTTLQSATTVLAPDTRTIGLRFEAIQLQALGSRVVLPPWPLLLAQLLLLGLVMALGRSTLLPWQATALLVAAAAVGLALSFVLHGPLLYGRYLLRLLVALLLIALIGLLLVRPAERTLSAALAPLKVRTLWGIALLGCAVRLIGALYPLFNAYDLGLNTDRLLRTLGGALVVTNKSFEFAGGVTVYPPGPYLVLLPTLLLDIPPKLVIQGGISLIDGFGAAGVVLLAHALGGSRRAVLWSGILYAAIPISTTSLWYGHTAQIFGQWLMAPLAVLLLLALREPRWRWWGLAGVVLSMAFLTHIGVTILAVAWMGIAWLLLSVSRRLPPLVWRRLTLTLLLSGIVGFLFAYAPVAVLKLQELQKVSAEVASEPMRASYNLIAKAAWISYTPLGALLVVPGLLLIRPQRLPRGAAALLIGWIAACLIFWAVEMVTALQVRYFVFFTPLACVLMASVFDRLANQGRAGRLVAWLAVLAVLVLGIIAWFQGTFAAVAPSMVPLLR